MSRETLLLTNVVELESGDRREWKWMFAMTTISWPWPLTCLRNSRLLGENDTARFLVTIAALIHQAVWFGIDRDVNSGPHAWSSSMMTLTATISLCFLVFSLLLQIRIYFSVPTLGDRLKTTDPLSFLATIVWLFYHLQFAFAFANVIQTVVLLNWQGVHIEHKAKYCGDAVCAVSQAFVMLILFNEYVLYWARFFAYALPVFFVYMAYAIAYPLPIPPGFFVIDMMSLMFGYGFASKVMLNLTLRYKNRPERELNVPIASQLSQPHLGASFGSTSGSVGIA